MAPLAALTYVLLSLLAIAYPIVHTIRAKRITGKKPPNILTVFIEGCVFMILALPFFLLLIPSIEYFPLLPLLVAVIFYFRLDAHLKPVWEQQEAAAAAELKAKQETIIALAPLLDILHGTYGQYANLADIIPAAWYQPRKHYLAYMASVLYHFYNNRNAYEITEHRLARDTHPLYILRSLRFPDQALTGENLADPEHPCNYLMRVITDTTHPDHIVFRDLIPRHVDLIPYLKDHRWQPAFGRHAADLAALVEQGIIGNRCIIIGRPATPNAYPFPIFYRDSRFRHSYLIGKTGSGKSTLLRNLIAQDIHHGNGVIVLSPENDLFEKLLAFIPKERKDDLIYFDPTDIKPPVIGFNPLTLEDGEDLNQKAGETMTVLTRALGDLGVTMEPLIQNAVYALLQCPESTFSDLRRLIDPFDPKLRATVKKHPTIDEATRLFWTRYEQSSYYQKSHEAVLNRLNPFLRPPISTILATPALSFKTELNSDRRIIFLNLSRLRGTEAATIGQLLLAQIQQALLVRDELPEDQRIPYYLYIDEFQTYAAHSENSLINLFNGARKYKLAVTIAHQTTADIPGKLLSSIVGNVGTVIALQLAAEDAPFFARELQIRKDAKDSYAPEALQNLTTGYGYARTPLDSHGIRISIPSRPVVPLPDALPADELKSLSKKNYGLIPERDRQELTPEPTTAPRPAPAPEPAPEDTPIAAAVDEAPPIPTPEAPVSTESRAPTVHCTPRPARKPVVRKTIKKRSLIPEETIEIE